MNERAITTKALNQLHFHTGLVGKVSGYAPNKSGRKRGDAVIKFENCNAKLVAELREWAAHGGAGKVLKEVTNGYKKLLISDYISDEEGARLRESKINYLDNVGNAYLDIPPIYVLIQGKKPKDNLALDKGEKLFNETGLKVILALLSNDDLFNASYRMIADCADVSMGTIGWVLRELKTQGFISQPNRKYAWNNRTLLIRKWVEEFPNLKERYHVGTFYSRRKNWWQQLDLEQYEAMLGGEIAAKDYQTDFSPSAGEIFLGRNQHGNFARDLHLIESDQPKGRHKTQIEVYRKFWGCPRGEKCDSFVHPLVTYASLMDTWDPDSRELASKIGKQFI